MRIGIKSSVKGTFFDLKHSPGDVLWLYSTFFSKLLTRSVNEEIKSVGSDGAERAICPRARAFVSVYPTKLFWEKNEVSCQEL